MMSIWSAWLAKVQSAHARVQPKPSEKSARLLVSTDNDNVNDKEMKKLFWVAILLAGLFSLPLLTRADDYIDDVYYSPEVVITTPSEQPSRPYYNKSKMKEIIFLDNDKDTVAGQMSDTVRAIIKR